MGLSFLKKHLAKLRNNAFLKNDDGVTVIEFALLGPILGASMLVTIETGLILYVEYTMQTAVQEAARLVRTGRAQDGQWTAAKFKDSVCVLASILIDCQKKVTVYMRAAPTFAALQASVPSYVSISSSNYAKDANNKPQAPYNCGAPREAVALIATYDWHLVAPFMSAFANQPGGTIQRIVAFSMFRNEAFPASPTAVCPIVAPAAAPPPAP